MSQVRAGFKDTIESIELYLVSLPFDAARRETEDSNAESIDTFNASSRTFTQMESLIVKITTAQGLVGWGEGFGHKANPATWAALEHIVAPFFLGRTTELDQCLPAAEYAFHAFGRTGPIHYALSAIDIALWDIASKQAGKSLREFIDADARHEINAYASLVHYAEDPAEVSFHLSRAMSRGFKAFKLHESLKPAIQAARQTVGDYPLMVDVNCKWQLPEARSAFEQLSDMNLLWIEEPVFPPDDSQSLRVLNSEFSNVSGGENHSGVHGLINDMERGAIEFAQPSIGKIGGVSAMLQVREAGKRLDAHVIPHCFYYGPALLASAQIIALDPAVRLQDGQARPELEVPFLNWEKQLHPWHAPHQGLLNADGTLPLPTAPGIGFEPDTEVMSQHTIKYCSLGTTE
ncbi:mandelate racemase/muconate lactonizing enzyme family protein [Glutamicibacter halophytocola]|uniref:Mandelate racemase/muconate lactonizing enzyme family protein n=1 Tax=Glutamicibacter halophytocola TaxID=1933880 RepID=A0AA95BTJ4_9MICC|nr:mandelate racemase/muconate lactonizing enzyme family protein [Glutamicibacter halophytocola]UUX59113.1 mandelate racemase/muconate lactonizing enzyme family protein [Glutamicibacter halophytocola]